MKKACTSSNYNKQTNSSCYPTQCSSYKNETGLLDINSLLGPIKVSTKACINTSRLDVYKRGDEKSSGNDFRRRTDLEYVYSEAMAICLEDAQKKHLVVV